MGIRDPLWKRWPSFHDGITSHLIVEAYRSVVVLLGLDPPDMVANTHIRSIAMLGYLVSSFFFFHKTFADLKTRSLAVLLLGTSLFPQLWLCSELFAGVFLMWSLPAIVYGRSRWAWMVPVLLFGHSKPDLLLPAALLAAWKIAEDKRAFGWKRAARTTVLFLAIALTFQLPNLIAKGPSSLFSGMRERSLQSFVQHYGDFFAQHQLKKFPDPWEHWERWKEAMFPGTNTFGDIVRRYPLKVRDFVGVSLVHTIHLLFFHAPALSLAVLLSLPARERWTMSRPLGALMLLSLAGLLPPTFLSHLHVRYLAKYFPLAVCVTCTGWQALREKRSWRYPAWILSVGLVLGTQGMGWLRVIRNPPLGALFWFPD